MEIEEERRTRYRGYSFKTVAKFQKIGISNARYFCYGNDFLRKVINKGLKEQCINLDEIYTIKLNPVSYCMIRKGDDRKTSLKFPATFSIYWQIGYDELIYIGSRVMNGSLLKEDIPEAWRLPYQ